MDQAGDRGGGVHEPGTLACVSAERTLARLLPWPRPSDPAQLPRLAARPPGRADRWRLHADTGTTNDPDETLADRPSAEPDPDGPFASLLQSDGI